MSMDQDFSGDLSSFSMLDLFRMEAQAQSRVLTDGLLRSERASNPAALEAMMRAAHSTKGAAAIVGMAPMVKLAHAMEDVFVAAQQGRLVLDAGGVDVLLGAVDLMRRLADLPEADLADAGPHAAQVDQVLATLAVLQSGADMAPERMPPAAPVPSHAAPMPLAEPAAAAATAAPAPAAPPPRNELLTLAGQARLHAAQLRPWIESLYRYKRQQRAVFTALERLHEAIEENGDPRLAELSKLVQERAAPLRGAMQRNILDAEQYERRA